MRARLLVVPVIVLVAGLVGCMPLPPSIVVDPGPSAWPAPVDPTATPIDPVPSADPDLPVVPLTTADWCTTDLLELVGDVTQVPPAAWQDQVAGPDDLENGIDVVCHGTASASTGAETHSFVVFRWDDSEAKMLWFRMQAHSLIPDQDEWDGAWATFQRDDGSEATLAALSTLVAQRDWPHGFAGMDDLGILILTERG